MWLKCEVMARRHAGEALFLKFHLLLQELSIQQEAVH